MLILLPPSEGKTVPGAGSPVELENLVFADALLAKRRRLTAELVRVSAGRQSTALKALGISARQADELERNATLLESAAAPALDVYSGVLYDRLDFGSLPAAVRKRAGGRLLISSALWGFLGPADPVPYYRMSIQAKLARIGALAAWWRPALAKAVPDRPGEMVVDMRSGSYAAAWRPKHASLVTVRAFTEIDGRRRAITHMVKSVRGDVTRLLLAETVQPASAGELAELLVAAGYTTETGDGHLDIIMPSATA